MKQKVRYYLYSGEISKTVKPLVYDYSNTKDIKLLVSQRGFSIEVDRTTKKDASTLLNDRLFRDAIKKVATIQLVKYGLFSDSAIYAEIEGVVSCIYQSARTSSDRLLYCLCGEKLLRPMTNKWSYNSLQRILTVTKSKTNRVDAALDALLIAKSKEYETEKFIYLWMALNGIYGFVAEKAKESMPSKKEEKWINKEYGQLKFFAMLLDYSYCGDIPKSQEDEIIRDLEIELSNVGMEDIEQFIISVKSNDEKKSSVQRIQYIFEKVGISKEEMHTYAALLLYMSYKIRCKYFHAEKAVPLICFKDEHPLPALRVLNSVIEEFLDENLYKWFDKNILETEFLPKIDLLAQNCVCDKNQRFISCEIKQN